MMKRNWKVATVLAALLSSSLVMGGQAFANGSTSGTVTTQSAASTTIGEKVVKAGLKYKGTPYQYASSRSTKATMDCSEFTMWAYREGAKIDMGRGGARSQARYVMEHGSYFKDKSKLKKGDLVFFMSYKGYKASNYKGASRSLNSITHVGIYMGDNKILHTYSKESGGVKVTDFDGSSWGLRFVAGGRPY